MVWVALGTGVFIGAFLGVLAAGLCHMASGAGRRVADDTALTEMPPEN